MPDKKPDPYLTVLKEVAGAVPPGYSRGDWSGAVEVLLNLHTGLLIDRIRSRLTAWPMARRTEPPLEPRYEKAVTLTQLQDVLEQVKRL